MTTLSGDHDETRSGLDLPQLQQLAVAPAFLGNVSVIAIAGLFAAGYMYARAEEIEARAREHFLDPYMSDLLLPASVAAVAGGFTNIALKGLAELLKAYGFGPEVILAFGLMAPAALVQINFINRGLALYPQTIMFPVYSALL